jgi:hypothetical protein
MTGVERVLDAGPMPYSEIALYGDADLEQGLRHVGFDPATTTYRLIEIPLASVGEVGTMPVWKNMTYQYVDEIRSGIAFPPIVVMPIRSGWTLLDGVNRTYAYWVLGRETVIAYELIVEDTRA